MEPSTKKIKTSREAKDTDLMDNISAIRMSAANAARIFQCLSSPTAPSLKEFMSKVCPDVSKFKDRVLVQYSFSEDRHVYDTRSELLTHLQWYIVQNAELDVNMVVGCERDRGSFHNVLSDWNVSTIHSPFGIMVALETQDCTHSNTLADFTDDCEQYDELRSLFDEDCLVLKVDDVIRANLKTRASYPEDITDARIKRMIRHVRHSTIEAVIDESLLTSRVFEEVGSVEYFEEFYRAQL